MVKRISADRTRVLQIAFVFLLVVCVAQVTWWVYDQVRYSDTVRARCERHYRTQLEAAEKLLKTNHPPEEVYPLFPDLRQTPDGPAIDLSVMERVTDERFHRLRRYAAEGGFFLLVLIGCIVVIIKTLREEAQLRRRQQNFLAYISHEFKSPLAALRLAAETIVERDPDTERRRRLLRRILDNLTQVEIMVANLLDTARLEEGRLHLTAERVVLAHAARGPIAASRARLEAEGIALEVGIDDDLQILADSRALTTSLLNLLDNARKAVVRGGGGEVRVRANRRDRWVDLEVVDTGDGFQPDEAERLFEKFYRPGDELRRTGKGSGLGLYIVKRLVESTGGRVKAASAGPGSGATFTLSWPALEEDTT